ncbi:MAG: hypothetical protein ACOC0D_03680 [Spirochaeta sp.]
MKRTTLITVIALLLVGGGSAAATSFSVGLGSDFFRYEHTYLSTQLTYIGDITENVELNIGGTFGIRVEEQQPGFLLPLHLGLDFLFPEIVGADGLLGIGVTPAFNWGVSVDNFRFYLGPHIRAGVRIPVHPFMRWYIEVQQNLHIGPPQWISTSTRVMTGINFFFGQ